MTILPQRWALYLPASNPHAIEKARTLPADMIILDLEDAVRPGLKDEARHAAVNAVAQGFGDRLTAIRINGADSDWHTADLIAARVPGTRLQGQGRVWNANWGQQSASLRRGWR